MNPSRSITRSWTKGGIPSVTFHSRRTSSSNGIEEVDLAREVPAASCANNATNGSTLLRTHSPLHKGTLIEAARNDRLRVLLCVKCHWSAYEMCCELFCIDLAGSCAIDVG